jgi:signal transduction histidine kinase
MTESKELVITALARAQSELEEAMSELERMPAFDAGSVAFAAHTLNNYLNVTGATIELIMMHLENHTDPQLRVWLDGVQHATNLMTRIVSQLMNASVDTETPFKFEKVDLSLLARRACEYYQRVAARKAIQIIVNPAVNVTPVWADRAAVAAVLDNLLSNAIKYSKHRKKIWVEMQSTESWTACDVRDEGPGLSQEDQAKLFQRGVPLTPKPTGGESSTGYGLAVALELIEKLGGKISCKSVLGQGSCFSFCLPACPETMQEAGKTD